MPGASGRREIAHHNRAIACRTEQRSEHCDRLAAAIRRHERIRREHALDRVEVAAFRRGHESLQHVDASCFIDAEAATLGSDALARAMHELSARGRRLAERLRDVVVVAIEDIVQHEGGALFFAEALQQVHEGDGQVARELRVRLGRRDFDFRERLRQPRTEATRPARLRSCAAGRSRAA